MDVEYRRLLDEKSDLEQTSKMTLRKSLQGIYFYHTILDYISYITNYSHVIYKKKKNWKFKTNVTI